MSLPISYSVRNVRARLRRTSLTIAVIALAVIASAVFLALLSSLQRDAGVDRLARQPGRAPQGLRTTTDRACSRSRRIRRSATSTASPAMPRASRWCPRRWSCSRRSGRRRGVRENVLARGVEPMAFLVHDQVHVVGGPHVPAEQRRDGDRTRHRRALSGRGARRGDAVRASALARGRHHGGGGSSFESEVWVDARELANDANRPFPYSGVRLRLAPGADRDTLIAPHRGRPALRARGQVRDRLLRRAGEELALALFPAGGAGGARRHRGRSRRRQHDVRRGPGADGRDRHAARARLLARHHPARVSAASRSGSRWWASCVGAVGTLVLAAVIGAVLGGIGFAAQTFTTNVVSAAGRRRRPRGGVRLRAPRSASSAACCRPGAQRASARSRRSARDERARST